MYKTYLKELKNQKLYLIIPPLLTLLLAGCGSDSSNTPASEPPQLKPETGVWTSQAYGVVVDISDADFTFYQFTSQYCQTYPIADPLGIDFDSLIASSEVSSDGNVLNTTLAGAKVPGIALEKQDQLPQHCIDSLLPSAGEANYEFNPQRDFEIFWQVFDEQYAFFELEGLNWAEVYEEASLAVANDTSEEELFGIFAQMIEPLNDFHVDLFNPTLGFEYTSPSRKPNVDTIALMDFLAINELDSLSSEAEYLQFLEYLEEQKDRALSVILNQVAEGEEVHFNDTQTMYWTRVNGNIGYLLLNTMDDIEIGGSESIDENLTILASTLDQVLNDLVGVEGLAIDVRYNEGGDDFVSQYIAGRLTSQPFKAYGKQARLGAVRTPLQSVSIEVKGDTQYIGPVAILSSMSTSSAAESFTLTMRERMNTVIIGEESAGGFSDQLIKVLPSGMVYTVSNEFYSSVAGEEFEGLGVPVDIEVAFFTREQREAEKDLGFEAALEWLMNF